MLAMTASTRLGTDVGYVLGIVLAPFWGKNNEHSIWRFSVCRARGISNCSVKLDQHRQQHYQQHDGQQQRNQAHGRHRGARGPLSKGHPAAYLPAATPLQPATDKFLGRRLCGPSGQEPLGRGPQLGTQAGKVFGARTKSRFSRFFLYLLRSTHKSTLGAPLTSRCRGRLLLA